MRGKDREQSLCRLLSDIEDPEERARTAREWGFVGLMANGKPGFAPIIGAGPQSSLNRAIAGHDPNSFYQGDADAIATVNQDDAEATRRKAYLTKSQVRLLFDSSSFMTQEFNALFNAQVTFVYGHLGISDEETSTALLSEFLREAGMRLRDWGVIFHWMYVHESSEERGFHTHVVAAIPTHLRDPFTKWVTKRFLAKRFGMEKATGPAVKVQISGLRQMESRIKLHGHRLRYLCKGLDPTIMDRGEDGRRAPLIVLIGIEEKFRHPAGRITSAQRTRVPRVSASMHKLRR